MRNSSKNFIRRGDDVLRLCLLPAVDFSGLASLFHEFDRRRRYRVCLDVSNVSRWGTVEFRVLGSFAESFKLRGGFVRLENASGDMTALVRSFGCTRLLPDLPTQKASP
jgi:anti-anti-sigma regulatory factor